MEQMTFQVRWPILSNISQIHIRKYVGRRVYKDKSQNKPKLALGFILEGLGETWIRSPWARSPAGELPLRTRAPQYGGHFLGHLTFYVFVGIMDTAVKVIVIGYQEKSFTDKCMFHFIYRFTKEFLNDD